MNVQEPDSQVKSEDGDGKKEKRDRKGNETQDACWHLYALTGAVLPQWYSLVKKADQVRSVTPDSSLMFDPVAMSKAQSGSVVRGDWGPVRRT